MALGFDPSDNHDFHLEEEAQGFDREKHHGFSPEEEALGSVPEAAARGSAPEEAARGFAAGAVVSGFGREEVREEAREEAHEEAHDPDEDLGFDLLALLEIHMKGPSGHHREGVLDCAQAVHQLDVGDVVALRLEQEHRYQ